MVLFRYSAIDAGGQWVRGAIEAGSEAEAIAALRRQGHLPVRARIEGGSVLDRLARIRLSRFGLSRAEVAHFTADLAIMLGAGTDLDRALRFLVETARRPRLGRIFAQIRDRLRDGGTLAAALQTQGASFPPLYVGLVRAGEAGGSLAQTLQHLGTLLERERALAASVTSALIYPAILVAAAVGAITLLLTEVLPQFVPLFAQNGVALPALTQGLIGTGAAVSAYGLYGLAASMLLLLMARRALRRPGLRRALDGLLLRVPLTGALLREVLAARFSRSLGTLVVNGVPLITALGIISDALGNRAAAAAVATAAVAAKGGAGLARPLSQAAIFPPRMLYLLRLGEETGQLGPMLLRAAEVHEAQARIGIERLVALLVPAIIVGMGAVVATIVSSLLLAMLGLNDLAN